MPNDRPAALVTGASRGLGRELARLFAADGHDLVITARDESDLNGLAVELQQEHGSQVFVMPVDLAATTGAEELVDWIERERVTIEWLVNNAGFGTYGPFVETDLDDTLAMLRLNIIALTELTRRLVPGMIERGAGGVMNVASTAAFQPGPLMAGYYASKAFVLHFTEALAEELRDTPLRVSAFCPGPTETDFQRRAKMQKSKLVEGRGMMDAAKAARIGYDGLMNGRRVVVPGAMNRMMAQSNRFAPRRLVTKIVRRIQEPTKPA
ncbi:MAG: SDR family NAD(P)-dependent oxidoreductase [Phycisphaerales bacterium]